MDPPLQTSEYDFSDEGEDVPDENVVIHECEGIPRSSWSTKVVILQNTNGVLVAEGICHNVNSDLIIGSDGPLEDSLVAVQISKSLVSSHFVTQSSQFPFFSNLRDLGYKYR